MQNICFNSIETPLAEFPLLWYILLSDTLPTPQWFVNIVALNRW